MIVVHVTARGAYLEEKGEEEEDLAAPTRQGCQASGLEPSRQKLRGLSQQAGKDGPSLEPGG